MSAREIPFVWLEDLDHVGRENQGSSPVGHCSPALGSYAKKDGGAGETPLANG